MGEENFVARVATGEACGPLSGILRDLQAGGGSGQRREENHAQFPLNCCFSWLPCTLPKGSVLSWVWAQATGRAREGLFPSRGRRCMVISDIGRPGCWAVYAAQVLLAKPSDFWEILAMLALPNCRES